MYNNNKANIFSTKWSTQKNTQLYNSLDTGKFPEAAALFELLRGLDDDIRPVADAPPLAGDLFCLNSAAVAAYFLVGVADTPPTPT